MKNTLSKLLLIHAETPLHPGSGSALGAIDLPVARERHTQWPLIPGSSLKGVLKDQCRDEADTEAKTKVAVVFGPETDNASDNAGALSLTDARLLAFPVRSLRGLFAWTMCPAGLDRLHRDLKMSNSDDLAAKVEAVKDIAKDLKEDKALAASEQVTTDKGEGIDTNMVLEEFDYKAKVQPAVKELGEALDKALGQGTRLGTHLVIIPDDNFSHYSRFATEVMARIGIDSATKTVKDGALFYEEYIPAGTLFYSLLIAFNPYTDENTSIKSKDDVLKFVADKLESSPYIQVGSNATIGKGICHVAIMEGAGA